jgi:hypothetical protein
LEIYVSEVVISRLIIEELKTDQPHMATPKSYESIKKLIFRAIFETIEQCGNAESFEQKMKTQI